MTLRRQGTVNKQRIRPPQIARFRLGNSMLDSARRRLSGRNGCRVNPARIFSRPRAGGLSPAPIPPEQPSRMTRQLSMMIVDKTAGITVNYDDALRRPKRLKRIRILISDTGMVWSTAPFYRR
jgi:hypothetical protein